MSVAVDSLAIPYFGERLARECTLLALFPIWIAQRPASGYNVTFIVSNALQRRSKLSSRPEEFHLRALPEPCRNLSIHTAPDVRPLPWHKTQWAKRCGLPGGTGQTNRVPLWSDGAFRLNLRRAQRMT